MMKNIIHSIRQRPLFRVLFNVIIALVLFSFFVSVPYVFAEVGRLDNPLKDEYGTLDKLIGALLKIIIKIGIPIAALFLVYAGFMFVTSRGEPKKLDTAKSIFWWTVVGTAIVVGAEVIRTVLTNTIGSITK